MNVKWRNLFSRTLGRGHVFLRIGKALKTFLPMMRDCLKGRYRPVPYRAIVLMILALSYLVMPFDLIPDFIPFFGQLDDILICGWLLVRLDDALEDYRRWKTAEGTVTTR